MLNGIIFLVVMWIIIWVFTRVSAEEREKIENEREKERIKYENTMKAHAEKQKRIKKEIEPYVKAELHRREQERIADEERNKCIEELRLKTELTDEEQLILDLASEVDGIGCNLHDAETCSNHVFESKYMLNEGSGYSVKNDLEELYSDKISELNNAIDSYY